jgi:hypothetical protein
MAEPIERLENDVLQLLLRGDDPVLAVLQRQLELASRKPRELSGVGFFTDFDVPDHAPRISGNPSIRFGDVFAEVEGLARGVGFLLFVDSRVITMLEAYTFDELWPDEMRHYALKYTSGETRDLPALRQTPGWPPASA